MKKGKFLNSEINKVLSDMGHMDQITIGDAGLPTPAGVHKIDLALMNGLPSFMNVLELIIEEMEIEKIIIAEEMMTNNPKIFESIEKIFKDKEVEIVSHDNFKRKTTLTKAIIRTGECTPYANIILQSGVIFG